MHEDTHIPGITPQKERVPSLAQAAPMDTPLVAAVRPWAIILAAGAGSRLAATIGNIPKQFLEYRGAPLYRHSALTMSRTAAVAGIVFVFPPHCLEAEKESLHSLESQRPLGLPWKCVAGGPRRQDSVWLGLQALPPECRHVLVHDAARPFASVRLLQRLCRALEEGAVGVIPGVPVTDTIKEVQHGLVRHTPEREKLCAVQTPQAFDLSVLRAAHEMARQNAWEVTDDAALLERCTMPVAVVPGEAGNNKITNPQDLAMIQEHTLPPLPCTGFGYDVHRFGKGRPLKLGGVPMQCDLEVVAHSDGDVLLHALMDAILGCAGAGDIGLHFPDNSPAFDNADSAVLLDDVLRIAKERGLTLVHVDLTVITQKPKVGPQRSAIQKNVAALLSLPADSVNVKATTEEGLGFTGAGEGIKAVAVVTALRPQAAAANE